MGAAAALMPIGWGEMSIVQAGVLFVCMGNICRSPTAEGVFRTLVARKWPAARLVVDSAGTHDYQVGEFPNPSAIAAAKRRGYELPRRRARQIAVEDFRRFAWILAMDQRNLAALIELRPTDFQGHLGLLLDFAPELGTREVPDPYYGASRDFDEALRLIEGGTVGLLDAIRERKTKFG
jgi:protein-tyrosine phosphatase